MSRRLRTQIPTPVRVIIGVAEKPLAARSNLLQQNQLQRRDQSPQLAQLQGRGLLKYFHRTK